MKKEVQYIVIEKNGDKYYFNDQKMTKYHRLDGPAIEKVIGFGL